jgi:hypothetical protein
VGIVPASSASHARSCHVRRKRARGCSRSQIAPSKTDTREEARKLAQVDRRPPNGGTVDLGLPAVRIEAQLSGEAEHPEPVMDISDWTVERLEAYAAAQHGQELERALAADTLASLTNGDRDSLVRLLPTRAIQSRGTGVCGDKRSLAVSQLFR